MFSRRNLIGFAAMILAIPILVIAQQPTPTSPEGSIEQEKSEGRERLRERRGELGKRHQRMREHGMRHLMRGLELTDAQREQLKAISQRRMESTKLQRDELSQLREKRRNGTFSEADQARAAALREQIRASMEGIRAEAEAILTAEQKAQLEQRNLERKARHEERKLRREQRLKERQERLNKSTF
jgi:protein CpxP